MGEIDRQTFEHVMDQPEVLLLLDELDVDESDRNGLFEVLDSDNSGGISIEEFINGILMIRGAMKKSDAIATRLAVKSLQKSLRNCRLQLLKQSMDMSQDIQKLFSILMLRLDATAAIKKGGGITAKNGSKKPS